MYDSRGGDVGCRRVQSYYRRFLLLLLTSQLIQFGRVKTEIFQTFFLLLLIIINLEQRRLNKERFAAINNFYFWTRLSIKGWSRSETIISLLAPLHRQDHVQRSAPRRPRPGARPPQPRSGRGPEGRQGRHRLRVNAGEAPLREGCWVRNMLSLCRNSWSDCWSSWDGSSQLLSSERNESLEHARCVDSVQCG